MTVTADSYDAKLSAAIVTMVGACAAWTWTANQIAEDWGGQDKLNAAGTALNLAQTWALVRLGPTEEETVAAWTTVRRGTAEVILAVRSDAADKPAEAIRRARNLAGLLADQLRAQLGGAGKLLYATFHVSEVFVTQPGASGNSDSTLPRELEVTLTIRWSEIP